MTRMFAALSLGLALVAAPLAAAAEQGPLDPNEMICKREKKVNSRFTTKTCYTRAQWTEIAERAKRDLAEQRTGVVDGRKN